MEERADLGDGDEVLRDAGVAALLLLGLHIFPLNLKPKYGNRLINIR